MLPVQRDLLTSVQFLRGNCYVALKVRKCAVSILQNVGLFNFLKSFCK